MFKFLTFEFNLSVYNIILFQVCSISSVSCVSLWQIATARLGPLSYFSEITTSIAVVSISSGFYEQVLQQRIIQKCPLQASLYNNQQYCHRTIYLFTTVRQCVNIHRILNKLNAKCTKLFDTFMEYISYSYHALNKM